MPDTEYRASFVVNSRQLGRLSWLLHILFCENSFFEKIALFIGENARYGVFRKTMHFEVE